MNRIDRVTAILIQLQSRKVIKAQDIADRFNISLRTVYRDINTLQQSGIPVIGEAGVGYSIMDGYRLPPVMFTKEEAMAFLTAEKFMEKFTDASTDNTYKSAMYKIKAVLRSTEKDMLENMEDHIQVMQSFAPFSTSSVNNLLPAFLKSISEKKALHINYVSAYTNESTERDVEPIGIFFVAGYWHSIAFCKLRNDYRDFRIDRISSVKATDNSFSKQHPTLKEYLEQMYKHRELQPIVIRLNHTMAKYLDRQKYSYGFVLQTENHEFTEMTFLTASIDGFARWFLSFADHASIVQPASLNDKIKSLITKIANNLESYSSKASIGALSN